MDRPSSVCEDNSVTALENKVESITHVMDKSPDQSTNANSLQADLLPSQNEKLEENVCSSVDTLLPISEEPASYSDAGPNPEDEIMNDDHDELDNGNVSLSDRNSPISHQIGCEQENVTEGEEYKLLSVLDQDGSTEKNHDLDYENSYSIEASHVSKSISKSQILEENIESSDEVDDQSEVGKLVNVELSVTSNTSMSTSKNDNANKSTVKENINDIKQLPATESAFQKLANLGLIANENPNSTVESKESVLQKLASRGAISITAPGGFSLPPSVSKSVTIIPSQPKNYKPGPKSMKKQEAKKIKIDPGKSMDIDKDFSSLINILSSGAERDSDQSSEVGLIQDKHVKNLESEIMSEKISDEVNTNLRLEQNICNDQMDIDAIEDHSAAPESDSESHDGNKSGSQGSEERDESVIVTSYKLKNVIEEGSAEILLSATKNVFYNKVQEFNRDMR